MLRNRRYAKPVSPTLVPRTLCVLFVGLMLSMTLFTRIPGLLVLFVAPVLLVLLCDRLWRDGSLAAAAWIGTFVLVLGTSGYTSQVWIGNPDRMAGLAHWLAWLGLGLIIPSIVDTERRWRTVLVLLALLGAYHATGAIIEPLLVPIDDRHYGFTANPGFLGLWCVVGLIASVALAVSGTVDKRRVMWLGVGVVCLVGLVLSETRAAALALAGAWVVLPSGDRWRVRETRWALFAGLLVVSLFFLDPIRVDLWRYTAWEVLTTPLGHGVATFYHPVPADIISGFDYSDFPHNMVLQVGYDFGWMGLLLLGGFVWLAVRRLDGPWRSLGMAFAVYSLYWVPSPGWFLFLALLMGRVFKKEVR